jgi:hypothetical protein
MLDNIFSVPGRPLLVIDALEDGLFEVMVGRTGLRKQLRDLGDRIDTHIFRLLYSDG